MGEAPPIVGTVRRHMLYNLRITFVVTSRLGDALLTLYPLHPPFPFTTYSGPLNETL